eukprot:XP_008757521.1 PREDICTED: secretoglobin family 2B member 24 isoform X1 [Rattus norvegicus]
MKGTLLLLTLLVIGELGFQTTEACFPFFGLYLGTVSGSKLWLQHELSYFNPTPGETDAYEKIQNCFNEAGSLGKFRDIKVMVMSFLQLLSHAANRGRLCTNDQCNH